MNPFRKVYCRIFQEFFHFAIPFLPYRKPKRLSHVDELPSLFRIKNVPWHILAPSAAACGILLLRANAHPRRAFCDIGNDVSYIIKNIFPPCCLLQTKVSALSCSRSDGCQGTRTVLL